MADAVGWVGAGGGGVVAVALGAAHPVKDGGGDRGEAEGGGGDVAERARVEGSKLQPLLDHGRGGVEPVRECDVERSGQAQLEINRYGFAARFGTHAVEGGRLAGGEGRAVPEQGEFAARQGAGGEVGLPGMA